MKIPLALLQARFEDPRGFKTALLEYLSENGYKVDREKSIAELILYHQQTIATLTTANFFAGTPTAASSNMAQFIRPEAEHFIILGMKVLTGNNASLVASDWAAGAGTAIVKNGVFSVTTNGVTVVDGIPGTAADPTVTDHDKGMVWLSEPIVWAGQNKLNVRYTGQTAGASADNLRIELWGVGLVS